MSASFSRIPLPRRVATILGAATITVAMLVGVSASPAGATTSGARPGTPRGAAAVLSAGNAHTCAVLEDGRIRCWGNNLFGQLALGDTATRGDNEPIHDLPTISLGDGRATVEVTAGDGHACARRDDGVVKCWGYNEYGKLGQGDNTNRGNTSPFSLEQLPPINLGTGRTARSIAAGGSHTCALLDNGSVKCWGRNITGQLGLGHANPRGNQSGQMGDPLPAVDLGTGRTATAIATGSAHTCALLDNAAVKCWGYNEDGRLGLGDVATRGDQPGEMGDALPEVSLGAGRAAAISAGGGHTCVVLDHGAVKCWGRNSTGQLGIGTTDDRGDQPGEMGANLPVVDLGPGRSVNAISAGFQHTCALLDDRTVKCWGRNEYGQLGLGHISTTGDNQGEMGQFLSPVSVGTNRTVRGIAAGTHHTCALLDTDATKCWGRNTDGQLGLNSTSHRGDGGGEMGDALPAVQVHSSLQVRALTVAPAAPTNLVATPGAGLVQLSWSAPVDNGGAAVTGYRIESSSNGIVWSVAVANTASTATSRTITGLTAGVATQFRVAAINSVGISPPTFTTTPVTPTAAEPGGTGPAPGGGAPVPGGGNPAPDGGGVELVSLSPARLLDTRGPDATVDGLSSGAGLRPAGSVTEVQVAGRGGVPSDATAAILNVTMAGAGDNGYAAVYPCGQPVPTASNLNYRSGDDIPNAAITKLGDNGKICIYTSAPGHLLADVNGYLPAGSPITTSTPARLLDSRAPGGTIDGQYSGDGQRPAGSITEVQVAGRAGVPTDAAAAVFNVTIAGAGDNGYAAVYPCGQAIPTASNLNFRSGDDIANAVIAKLGDNGKICIYTSATAHLLTDINGYLPAGTAVTTMTPARLLDTRAPGGTIDGQYSGDGQRLAGSVTEVQIAGRAGVPTNATTAILNVTIAGAGDNGYAAAYPCGQPIPTASNLNYAAGDDIANAVIAKLGDNGKICIYTSAPTHLLTDINGHLAS